MSAVLNASKQPAIKPLTGKTSSKPPTGKTVTIALKPAAVTAAAYAAAKHAAAIKLDIKGRVHKISDTPPGKAAQRLAIGDRTEQILVAATKIASKVGLMAFSRAQVAKESGVSDALVTRYFTDMPALRDSVVQRAIDTGNARILAEALAYKHKAVTKIKGKVRDAVVKYLFD